jgi:hypothetical protein
MFRIPHFLGEQIKQDEMGEYCVTYGVEEFWWGNMNLKKKTRKT